MPTFSAKGNDEYICQICTDILDSVDYPPEWRPDITGSTCAGNVCPTCVEEYHHSNPDARRPTPEELEAMRDAHWSGHNVKSKNKSGFEVSRDESQRVAAESEATTVDHPAPPTKKQWTRDQINTLLQTSDAAVERAMVVLFNRQTSDEQQTEETKHLNGVGFAGNAAHRGSYYAKWVLSKKRLTGIHLERARKIALRHSKQLVEEANKQQ